ncbi:hypothetical protein GDO78_021925 [Eleutherodactylus coqui]|uniref:Uncharacterized protein n=1 Tax=Eleutherodactylus coqui TaxID=57060 RepID=A0A8J6E551_ELECQ|nr:hypothetical protein GDO78_021925 [Eleutherodactylus coqui]
MSPQITGSPESKWQDKGLPFTGDFWILGSRDPGPVVLAVGIVRYRLQVKNKLRPTLLAPSNCRGSFKGDQMLMSPRSKLV